MNRTWPDARPAPEVERHVATGDVDVFGGHRRPGPDRRRPGTDVVPVGVIGGLR